MKPKMVFRRSAVLAAMAMLYCGALLISSNARACPAGSDFLPAGEPITGWNGEYYSNYTLSPSGCPVQVMWCWRVFPDGTKQIIVESVEPEDPSGMLCDGLTGDQLIKLGAQAVFNDPINMCEYLGTTDNTGSPNYSAGIPNCPSEQNTVSFTFSYCWQYVGLGLPHPDGSYTSYAYQYCVDADETCVKTCQVCCDQTTSPPTVTYSDCSYSTLGDGSCDPPPPPPAPWIMGTCYNIGCP
jgi:hypothetical protein